ncbi:filamin-A-like [Limulus polyphemus]|uniref:Filamin-A-like n=1 Tax=Limulus polyphemus TaxID=6850 RepID=A0ABM1C2U8_LIMPO|nr:filamin-A-like [Limulus polyphemus]
MPPTGDSKKVELGAIPEGNLRVNKPVAFTVHMNGARGMLDGKVVAPSGCEDDCFLVPIDEDLWALRFIPRENGIHQVHIRHNGVHIPESPFRVRVGQEGIDPTSVRTLGNGLKECKAGTQADFTVDTRNAGLGTLAVTIDGPSKVSMDCTEVEEGYKVRYTPLAPGDYFIIVKYNGNHIAGSPFKVRCTGTSATGYGEHETSSVIVETVTKQAGQKSQSLPAFRSDAKKVTCKGMGVQKAFLHKQNTFTVNCGDAGNNLLYVSIYGPKGPSDEVFVKHLGRHMYQVNYVLKEKGEYVLVVKWGDEHIPGSPFKVEAS